MEISQPTRIRAKSLVQDSFLECLRQSQVLVSIYLVSGIRLKGCIADFDMRGVLLRSDTQQLIYKGAIATIVCD